MTGDAATAAMPMLGRRASMPNWAEPLTLAGESRRLTRLADQGEVGRVLQLDGGREVQLGRRVDQFAEVARCGSRPRGGRCRPPPCSSSGSTFQAWAAAWTSTVRTLAPASRSGFQAAAHRGRAAGHLAAQHRVGVQRVVGRGLLQLDLGQVGAQLLGQQHRHRGEGALPHLDLVDDQGDDAVAVDADEGVVRQARRFAGGAGGGLADRLLGRRFLAVALPAASCSQPNSEKPNSRPPPASGAGFQSHGARARRARLAAGLLLTDRRSMCAPVSCAAAMPAGGWPARPALRSAAILIALRMRL